MINQSRIDQGMTYAEYRTLLDDLFKINRTTGENQTDAILAYAKTNLQRMRRLDKTIELSEPLKTALQNIQKPQTWLVLTEGWCGDAAQSLPIINKMAEFSDKIELVVLLRDENLDIMDLYLTNGGRSIPKLVMFDQATLQEIANWGPRPAEAHALYWGMKNQGEEYTKISTELHTWYAHNKTVAVQNEILNLINNL